MKRTLGLSLGAVSAAVAASACCIGPLLLAVLGVGGAGVFVALEPLRPLMALLTLGLLVTAAGLTWRDRRRRLQDDCGCALPRSSKLATWSLWLSGAFSLVALTFPWWLTLLA